MLTAAIDISTAKHYHPDKEVLGKNLRNCAGGIENIAGDNLVDHQAGHNSKNNCADDFKDLIDHVLDLVQNCHGAASFLCYFGNEGSLKKMAHSNAVGHY